MEQIKKLLKEIFEKSNNKIELLNELNQYIHEEISIIKEPVDFVKWIEIDKIEPNDYNPNSVAKIEMGLLYKSIKHDGYTQPIVVIYDKEKDKYIIIDGFHRYYTAKINNDILNNINGHLPCVILNKNINERMAATVRHNRARGSHSVNGMGNLVFEMLENGMEEHEICNELGMEAEEILKLKHITGFSKLFKDVEYKKAWETKRQIKLRIEYNKNNK